MRTVRIQGMAITDEESLHREFAARMGFPGFYGENWNAWIDCMSYVTDPEEEMTTVHVAPGEELVVTVADGRDLEARCPALVKNLLECAGFVNERLDEMGEGTRIRILLEEAG